MLQLGLSEESPGGSGERGGAFPAKPIPSGSLAKEHSPPQRGTARRAHGMAWGTCFLLNKQAASQDE